MREFNRNMYKEMNDLPLVITVNGKDTYQFSKVPDVTTEPIVTTPVVTTSVNLHPKVATKKTPKNESKEFSNFTCMYPFCSKDAVTEQGGKWYCKEHS